MADPFHNRKGFTFYDYLCGNKSSMGRKKKDTKPSIFDETNDEIEEDKVKVKPETVVKLLAEEGKLPDDWCPYGNYTPERSKFIGDEPPYPNIKGEAKKWEVINDGDPDLTPIYFSLPSPPKDLNRIDNYGLEKDEQYFRRLEDLKN
jgi:hypothetical protein